jgi:hypothetical protein
MSIIDERIADCSKQLELVSRQIEDLKQQAAAIEGELRAYRFMRDNAALLPDKPTAAKIRPASASLSSTSDVAAKAERVSFSRLSPVWQGIIGEMVANFPKRYADDELRQLATKYGHEPGSSFRTALWHHMKRGNVERHLNDGTYAATEQGAQKAGVRWEGASQ